MRNLIVVIALITLALPVMAEDFKVVRTRDRSAIVFDLSRAYEQQYRITGAVKYAKEHPDWTFSLYVDSFDCRIKNNAALSLLQSALVDNEADIKKLTAELKLAE